MHEFSFIGYHVGLGFNLGVHFFLLPFFLVDLLFQTAKVTTQCNICVFTRRVAVTDLSVVAAIDEFRLLIRRWKCRISNGNSVTNTQRTVLDSLVDLVENPALHFLQVTLAVGSSLCLLHFCGSF